MTLLERAQKTMAEAAEAFLDSVRTELAVVRTMCILAQQEDGEKRTHHIQLAERAFASVLEIAKRAGPNQQDRDAIEEARYCIRRLGGRDFSQS